MSIRPDTPLLTPRVWGLLTFCGTLACAASVLGFFGRHGWFLDLLAHFRVQYLVSLGVLGGLAWVDRRRRTAAVFLVFACVNLALVAPFYVSPRRPASSNAVRLRAMLINVNRQQGDIRRVNEAVCRAAPDILVLEEISDRWMVGLAAVTNAYPYAIVRTREDNFGIGLFSKLPLTDGRVVDSGGVGVPSVLATVRAGDTDLRVVATHPLPPRGAGYTRGRDRQLERLPDFLRTPLPVLLLGDLNATPWSAPFRRLLARSGLRDSARGYGVQPTWPNDNPLLRVPIDHCLHSPGIAVVGRRIGPDVCSDHFPLIVDLAVGRPSSPDTRDDGRVAHAPGSGPARPGEHGG